MKRYSEHPPICHSVSGLPLFDWQPVTACPMTRAGAYLSRRYRVHPAVADLVASLAGLGSAVEA